MSSVLKIEVLYTFMKKYIEIKSVKLWTEFESDKKRINSFCSQSFFLVSAP